MVSGFFETKCDLKIFILEIIQSSPLSGRVDELVVRVDVLTVRVDELVVRVDVLTARVDELVVRVDVLTARVDELVVRVDVLTARVDELVVRVDVLTARVDELVVRVASIERILLEERFRNEQRDIKINAIYDMFVQMASDSERQRNLDKVVEVNKLDSDMTRSLLRSHTENTKIHVTPQRGRPRKGLKEKVL